jgi:glucans biosynthesis protein C
LESDSLSSPSPASGHLRRYDVDWLRIIALGLLVIYHVSISFQPWGRNFLFIQNEQSLEGLWVIISMFNIWRIPILFLISGMGVRFAMQRRTWKMMLKDRTLRILLPFIFGFFTMTPISYYFVSKYYSLDIEYLPADGHLWFLANIYLYVLLLLPVFVLLMKHPDNFFFRFLSGIFQQPASLFLAAIPILVEVLLVNPEIYSIFVHTSHGFWLGMLCFFTGFVFISIGDVFWNSVRRIRLVALLAALLLFLLRWLIYKLESAPNFLTAVESTSWMLAAIGFGSVYLNKPSRLLSYFSRAVYPLYIIHLPIQFCISYFLIPLPLPAFLKLILLIAGILGFSLLIYELIIRRIKWIRPLFGMKFEIS